MITYFFCDFYFRPEFKRFAALLGDMKYQAPRRFLLGIASKTQPAYSYRELLLLLSVLSLLCSQVANVAIRVHPGFIDSNTGCITCEWYTRIFWLGQTNWFHCCRLNQYVRGFANSESGVRWKKKKNWQFTLPIKATRMHQGIRSAFSGTSLGRNGRRLKKNLRFWHT